MGMPPGQMGTPPTDTTGYGQNASPYLYEPNPDILIDINIPGSLDMSPYLPFTIPSEFGTTVEPIESELIRPAIPQGSQPSRPGTTPSGVTPPSRGTMPGMQPGMQPGTTPFRMTPPTRGTMPGMQPGMQPEMQPGMQPEMNFPSYQGIPNFNPCTLIGEAEEKLGNWGSYFEKELLPFIEALPLACLIPDNALLLHGGVSSKIMDRKDLETPSDELRIDLLWSDPFKGKGEDPNYGRGAGVEFGADVSESVCKALGVERIVRSHQPQLAAQKPYIMHGGRVITVNATTVYGGLPCIYFIDPKAAKRDYYRIV
jgi:diadenosine tetraphosphatase ApaH/serine/threonine PP2A family protein phosphatase